MSCLCTEGSFFHLLLCAPPFRMSVVGAHENRLVAKANPHGAWDRGICIVNYILTHTQPETSSTCSCLLLSCCIGSALSSPLRQGVCVCVSHAPWSVCVCLTLLGAAFHPLQFGSPACLVTSVL